MQELEQFGEYQRITIDSKATSAQELPKNNNEPEPKPEGASYSSFAE